MDKVDMSLDDIIKLNKQEQRKQKQKKTGVAATGRLKQFRGRIGKQKISAGLSPLNRNHQANQKAGPKKQQLQARSLKSVQNARRTLSQRSLQAQRQARWNTYNNRRGLQTPNYKTKQNQKVQTRNKIRTRMNQIRNRINRVPVQQQQVQTQTFKLNRNFSQRRGRGQGQASGQGIRQGQARGQGIRQGQARGQGIRPGQARGQGWGRGQRRGQINRSGYGLMRSDLMMTNYEQEGMQRRSWGRKSRMASADSDNSRIMTISVTNDASTSSDVQITLGPATPKQHRQPVEYSTRPQRHQRVQEIQHQRQLGQGRRGGRGRGRIQQQWLQDELRASPGYERYRQRRQNRRNSSFSNLYEESPESDDQYDQSTNRSAEEIRPIVRQRYQFQSADFSKSQTGIKLSDRFAPKPKQQDGNRRGRRTANEGSRVVFL